MSEESTALRAHGIFETSLYGSDIAALERFYGRVLGLEVISRFGERGVALRCGRGMLLLFDPAISEREDVDVAPHGARGPGHVAFAVPGRELDDWRDRLAGMGVDIETEVEWERGRSIYFRDPAGNSVELATPGIWGFDGAAVASGGNDVPAAAGPRREESET